MKAGDRIKVIQLDGLDSRTDLKIGDTGIIEHEDDYNCAEDIDLFMVRFDNPESVLGQELEDGTYYMYRYQLEVIEESPC